MSKPVLYVVHECDAAKVWREHMQAANRREEIEGAVIVLVLCAIGMGVLALAAWATV